LAEVAGVVSHGEEEAPEGNSPDEGLPDAVSKEDKDFLENIDATEGGSPDEDATEGESRKDIEATERICQKDITETENKDFQDHEDAREGESLEDIDATKGESAEVLDATEDKSSEDIDAMEDESSEVLDATVLYETCHEESSGVEKPSASAIEEETVFKIKDRNDDNDDDKEEDLDRTTSARGAGSEIRADIDADAVTTVAMDGVSPSPESKDPQESSNWPPIANEEDPRAGKKDHVKGFRKRSRSLSEDEVETKFRIANAVDESLAFSESHDITDDVTLESLAEDQVDEARFSEHRPVLADFSPRGCQIL